MRPGHLWLASFVVYAIVGAPLLRARAFRAMGFPTRAVLSVGVGMVATSWVMTAFSMFRIRWGPLAVLAAAAAASALLLLLPKDERKKAVPDTGPVAAGVVGRRPPAARLVAAGLTAVPILAAFAATTAGRSTSPDLLLFWGTKAQQFAAARTIDVDFLSAPFLEYLHSHYPPLVTNVFAFGAMMAGRFPWGAATLTFPLLLTATAIGLAGLLKTERGPGAAAATTALATSAIGLVGIRASVAGNAEPFLLYFEILAVAVLLTPASSTVGGKLVVGLLLAGAATAKVEGLPFVLATAVLFPLADREKSRPAGKTLLLLLGPTVVTVGSWLAFGEVRKLFRGYSGYGDVLTVRWENLGTIVSEVGASLWKAGYALPWLVPLAVWILGGPRSRRAVLPIGTAVALAGFLLFTYLTTAGDPRLLISWSSARVLSPITALFALAAFASRSEPRDMPQPSSG